VTRREARAILVAMRKEAVQHAELCDEHAQIAAKKARHAADPQSARHWKSNGDVWIVGRNRSTIRVEALKGAK
jgi:hypothetical protein